MEDEKIIVAWISKYALSSGEVSPVKVRISASFPGMASSAENILQSFHGDDWHRSKEAACEKAESMRIRKIVSLKKQITKLEKMRFNS
jgi:hypothetical protein